MEYFQTKILSHKKIASDIYVLETGRKESNIVPGQFFMLKSWKDELPLMRPVSIYKIEENSLFFMYKKVGKGTDYLSRLKKGNTIELLGPLGNGFPVDQVSGRIALVAGGVGIPPMYECAKALLHGKNNSVDLYLGYRDEVFGVEDFEPHSSNIFISSEYGSEGYKGFITHLLHPEKYDAVFTCGPEPMMFRVLEICREKNVPVWLSMEKHMACGIGACLVCACETKTGMKRACKDGPVFSGEVL